MSAAPASRSLDIDALTVGYGSTVVQHDVSFKVAPGAIFRIMGGSGSGKSTLLKVMVGLLRPMKGVVRVDGEDYGAADETRRAAIGRGVGVLFQNGRSGVR